MYSISFWTLLGHFLSGYLKYPDTDRLNIFLDMQKMLPTYSALTHPNRKWQTHIFKHVVNPYKPSVLFVGHQQTVQNQITRRKIRRLIRFSTVCLQKDLLKFE